MQIVSVRADDEDGRGQRRVVDAVARVDRRVRVDRVHPVVHVVEARQLRRDRVSLRIRGRASHKRPRKARKRAWCLVFGACDMFFFCGRCEWDG